ncbi:MAG: hypothetical protein RR880_07445, partial [Bacteroidales bacterium]
MAQKGAVVGRPEFVTSFADYRRKFGGYLSENTHGDFRFLPYAIEQFFANGGARCYVMRVAPADAKCALTSMGSIVATAKNPGKWGNDIKITAVTASKAKSQIVEAIEDMATNAKVYKAKNASGFAVGDTVSLLENGNVVAYNKIAKIADNIITFEKDFETDIVDKNAVPKRILATCELNIVVSCEDIVEQFELVSFNTADSSFIDNRLSKSTLIDIKSTKIDDIFPPMLAL